MLPLDGNGSPSVTLIAVDVGAHAREKHDAACELNPQQVCLQFYVSVLLRPKV